MAYIPIGNVEKDVGSPVTSSLFVRLRDNPVEVFNNGGNAPQIEGGAFIAQTIDTAQIAPLAVTNARLGLNSISQAEMINAAAGINEVKTNGGNTTYNGDATALLVLPGGQYGFYPRTEKLSGGGISEIQLYIGNNAALAAYVFIDHSGVAGVSTLNQRWVIASPPHDLGDGPIPFFCYALVDINGAVVATYNAPEPPWMYNGPTKTTPDYRDSQGNGYILKPNRAGGLNDGKITYNGILIDQNRKKADMNLIPHPFIGMDLTGLTPVLLDPVGTERLAALNQAGENVGKILHDGYLKIDNNLTNSRNRPPGVEVSSLRWK